HPAGRNRIDIFIGRDRSVCGIIVETKDYVVKLDNHIPQLKIYTDEKRPLLAIIANGEEIRIFSPFMKVPSFTKTILYIVKRQELANRSILEKLEKILLTEKREIGELEKNIEGREKEIKDIRAEVEKLKKEKNTVSTKKQEIEKQKHIKIQEILSRA
ncbi:unnamed protein product, partial [marine sediment metagenome]